MRSEVELWVDAGPHGPRGRTSPLSQASSPEREEASQPQVQGRLQRLLSPQLWGELHRMGTGKFSEDQQPGGGIEERILGQSSGNLHSEGRRGDSGPGLPWSEVKEDTSAIVAGKP